jgi:hypothetical protein
MLGFPPTMHAARDADAFDGKVMERTTGPTWMFHQDKRPVDAISLCFFADQPPPSNVVFLNRARPKKGLPVLMPSTVSLSIHFHARPEGLRIINHCHAGVVSLGQTEGKNDNEILLWDETGMLVASSRQIVHVVAMENKGGQNGEQRMFGARI